MMNNIVITIHYKNGSHSQHRFDTVYAAKLFARDGISYSGGRVNSVIFTDHGWSYTLWKDEWDDVSKRASLTIGM